MADGTFDEELGKDLGLVFQIGSSQTFYGFVFLIKANNRFGITHDDTTGIEVVVQGLAFAQELG